MSRTRSLPPFAVRLAAVRVSYGERIGRPSYSMKDFAETLGVEAETYRRYERGETQPNLEFLARIRRVTRVNLNELIAGDIYEAA